jgi:CheY-like chemotaxis protein
MSKHVLIVDDDDAIRKLIADVLVRHGCAVAQAADGIEASRKVRAHRPDLIVLDLMLPGMTGWEFRAMQNQDPDLAAIPVVVISAVSSEKAGALGNVVAQLSKPFDFETFLWIVDQCLKRSSADGAEPQFEAMRLQVHGQVGARRAAGGERI